MQETISIGNVEVLAWVDIYSPGLPTSTVFPDVPEEAWKVYRENQLSPSGEIELPYCLFALSSGPHPTEGNLTGNLRSELDRISISPDDVDIVVHTHLHDDHVGWNITYDGGPPRPTFPNARYLVPQADWEHYTKPGILALPENAHIRDHVMPLAELGVMDLVEGGHTITPEVSTLYTPGHTPGHQCILINSQGERGAVVGDVTHMSVQVEHSDWCTVYDFDKAAGQKSREDLLDQLEREETVVAAGHFMLDQHFGRVVRFQGRRYWQGI